MRRYQAVATMLLSACLLASGSSLAEIKSYWFGAASFATVGGCTISNRRMHLTNELIVGHCEDNGSSEFFGSAHMLGRYRGTPITLELRVMSGRLMPTGSFAVDFSAKCGEAEDDKIPWGISTRVIVGLSTQYQIEEVKSQPITPTGVCGKGIPVSWRASVDEITTTESALTYILGVRMELE